MSKIETLIFHFISFSLCMTSLHGEDNIALLKSIKSNNEMKLLNRNIPVHCEPFGIITLETMKLKGASPEECRSSVERFYASHPHAKFFAREHLYIEQSYRYEMVDGKCALYANALESYSEMLLNEGLAVVDPQFDNKEWNEKLKRAERGAKSLSKGLHETEIKKFCIKEEK